MRTKIVCSAVVALFVISNFGMVLVNEQNTDGIIAANIETKANGTTYYVAKDGNDSNPGTLAEPWLTIGKANQELQPGDTVYIREGVYQESIAPINSGTSGKYITYQNYPDEKKEGNKKFMLGSCSAFVNYLVAKASQAKIKL